MIFDGKEIMENEWDHSEISSDENTQSSDHSTSADIDDEEHEYVDAVSPKKALITLIL